MKDDVYLVCFINKSKRQHILLIHMQFTRYTWLCNALKLILLK